MKAQVKEATKPEYEIVTITPKMAQAWLDESNFENRRLDEYRVNKIAHDIKNGSWIFDGTPIRFNGGGNLLDGQHRLKAIIKSGKSVDSMILRGLDSKAKNTIDSGKARSIGDILHFNGHVNTTSLAAAARLCIGYREFDGDMKAWETSKSGNSLSAQEILEETTKNSLLIKATQSVISLQYTKKLSGAGVPIFCYCLFSKQTSQHVADSFFQKLEHGNDLSSGSPILMLRNKLALPDSRISYNGRRAAIIRIALYIKAWNAWRSKVKMDSLSYNLNEPFPVVAK